MKAILIIALLGAKTCLSQDLHFVKGKVNTDAGLGTEYIYGCTLNIEKFAKKGDVLTLYGVKGCDGYPDKYFKVDSGEGLYLVKQQEIDVSDIDIKYLNSLTTAQDTLMNQKIWDIEKKKNEELRNKILAKINSIRLKGKQNGILIKKSQVFDQSEYTEGTGYEFSFINTSKKTIKYIWVTVKGINAVNDAVSSKTLKGVGPLEPETSGGYSFDYVWHTDIVETCKIQLIKIQYMDGTFKNIQNADSLIMSEAMYNVMYGSSED